ncbi:methyltransferase domain-containing protein [Flavihumibacter fluvii]|uniref:methyltransferase domain-containing protein n=1 Tax=Flavihumibacter fluvii TaxID=2838157 RepID=UPI001BDE8A98|nr:methyltransferase domain-containing protein [Flavihumibacter fluvii]ULQ53898.1 methyltransferase domain-containing protein [Flavihumibacter fluvii]
MLRTLLTHLRCPLSKGLLRIEIIDGKDHIRTGILYADCGMVYPVIDGIPRLLLESFIDNEFMLARHIPGFAERKIQLMTTFGQQIRVAQERNRLSKKSFSLEWRLLENNDHIKVWQTDESSYKKQLYDELNISEPDLHGKKVIDIGCGHGRTSALLARHAELVIGMDLGSSVVHVGQKNKQDHCHFIQADLHHLPFDPAYFDLVYSSGVIHHTENTENAFVSISGLVNKGGVLCVWLYQPYKNLVHQVMLALRKITIHLPLQLQFWLYLIFLVPVHKLVSLFKGHKIHWREIMINHLDMLSPQFRFEHTPGEVMEWYSKNHFGQVKTTTRNKIGFSIIGVKEV